MQALLYGGGLLLPHKGQCKARQTELERQLICGMTFLPGSTSILFSALRLVRRQHQFWYQTYILR